MTVTLHFSKVRPRVRAIASDKMCAWEPESNKVRHGWNLPALSATLMIAVCSKTCWGDFSAPLLKHDVASCSFSSFTPGAPVPLGPAFTLADDTADGTFADTGAASGFGLVCCWFFSWCNKLWCFSPHLQDRSDGHFPTR
uniref:(northern house mosquito) hypothetical protein n=1 Tax=Culex pipiens TaxID=7175 RepID=A0A8D8FQH3_CULPI